MEDTRSVAKMHWGAAVFKQEDETIQSFLKFLKSWGEKWMWNDLRPNEDPMWVAECLRNKTLVCVKNGLYMKDKVPNLCSAECVQTKRYISGTLVKRLEMADSYRGECLGMLAMYKAVSSGS